MDNISNEELLLANTIVDKILQLNKKDELFLSSTCKGDGVNNHTFQYGLDSSAIIVGTFYGKDSIAWAMFDYIKTKIKE